MKKNRSYLLRKSKRKRRFICYALYNLRELEEYHNTRNAKMTASWVAENTHYFITGSISEEEIISILESMMK